MEFEGRTEKKNGEQIANFKGQLRSKTSSLIKELQTQWLKIWQKMSHILQSNFGTKIVIILISYKKLEKNFYLKKIKTFFGYFKILCF